MPVKGRTFVDRLTVNGNKVGRPRAKIPSDAAQQIQELAATGHGQVGIAQRLGTNATTFSSWLSEYPELREAYDRGRERERHTLQNVLYRLATEGDDRTAAISAMFLLKARHGYREGDQGEQANRVQITFSLPGALKPDQFVMEEPHARIVEPLALPRKGAERSGGV